ncbi:MAG: hypothetical protein GXO02_02315 [Epsilonproteobacteria bacterium]|nr:hypothetical protein [Campylobacterota bacterium]
MKINRFPKMAALQKFRALKLGFSKDIAEALGIAEAVKYAIFKNISYKKEIEKEKEKIKKEDKIPSKKFDEEKFAIFKLAAINNLPYVGGKIYTNKEYKEAIFGKFGKNIGKIIEKWAEDIIKECDISILKSENKFFNQCWKPNRDQLKEIKE